MVGLVDDVENEQVCEYSCQMDEDCNLYTYHQPNSTLFPSTCFLLRSFAEPIRGCDTCISGLPDCEGEICAFLNDGYEESPLVISEQKMKKIELLQLGVCPDPLIVAVGGGGSSSYSGLGGGGGGGSGFVEYLELGTNQSYTQFMVNAGSGGEPSFVTVVSTNDEVVRAEEGSDASGYYGGDGYSGGGAGGYPTG